MVKLYLSLSSLKQLECQRINATNVSSHDVLIGLTNLIRTFNALQSLQIGNSSESDLDPLLPWNSSPKFPVPLQLESSKNLDHSSMSEG